MFYNVRTVLTSLQINHRRGLFVLLLETVFTSVSEFDVFTFLCLTHIVLQELPLDEAPNNIYVVFFFAVISGVVCRVCRDFSYYSEININIQYIFF